MGSLRRLPLAVALAAAFACAAAAAPGNWAAPQIRTVTGLGILGSSPASFAPQAPLTQGDLAAAIAATAALEQPQAPRPLPVTLSTNVGPGAVVAGPVAVALLVAGRPADHVDFSVDDVSLGTARSTPYTVALDTRRLADGLHTLAADVAFVDGGHALASWAIVVTNAAGGTLAPTGPPAILQVSSQTPPAAPAPERTLYRAASPAATVTLKRLDAALVSYLGLVGAARNIQSALATAGLRPPANTGTEVVARLLGLRLNHPAADDTLELLPTQPVTRAEAAYSFARLITLDDTDLAAVDELAGSLVLPELTPWQERILTTAIRYVGYPYVWGGTSPTAQTLFGVSSVGGFDCSGYVWRVYKLTSYPDEGDLASVLRGRTTYELSGEVPRSRRITAKELQPGDVMFFGARGPASRPAEVDHAALYLGGGWLVQSSGDGVTLAPFRGWYAQRFAWGRRPLREAGLTP